jgi:hypothetical protein
MSVLNFLRGKQRISYLQTVEIQDFVQDDRKTRIARGSSDTLKARRGMRSSYPTFFGLRRASNGKDKGLGP